MARANLPALALLGSILTLQAASPADSVTLRLATFNIHHAEGSDGVLSLERVADVLRGADVIALQEVDVKFGERSRFEDQAARLAKLLGGSVEFGANLVNGDRRYGVALVSKYPIVAARNHPLPRALGREKAEPRGLLETTLDVHGRRVRVYVTHLAHDSKEDRRLQVAAIRRIISLRERPAILMGDLNLRPDDPHYQALLAAPEGSSDALLDDAWTRVGQGPGHTIGLEGKSPGRIDYILVSPDLVPGLRDARVDTATRASDHQPVFATLELPRKP